MAKELVGILNTDPAFSNGAVAHYELDHETPLKDVTTAEIRIAGTLSHVRTSRNDWSASVSIDVIAVAGQEAVGANSGAEVQDEKNAWLEFIDTELIEQVKSNRLGGKKPTGIEFSSRLDKEQLRLNALFYTQFQINYPLV